MVTLIFIVKPQQHLIKLKTLLNHPDNRSFLHSVHSSYRDPYPRMSEPVSLMHRNVANDSRCAFCIPSSFCFVLRLQSVHLDTDDDDVEEAAEENATKNATKGASRAFSLQRWAQLPEPECTPFAEPIRALWRLRALRLKCTPGGNKFELI